MQLQSMHHLEGIEVPNNDVSLETHMSLLTRCNILSSLCNFYDGDIVVVASQKLLCSRDNMSNYQSSTERIDNVFVVWVEN